MTLILTLLRGLAPRHALLVMVLVLGFVVPAAGQQPPAPAEPLDKDKDAGRPTGQAQPSTSPGDTPSPAPASSESAAAQQPPDLEELRRRIDVLAAEIERLRSGEEERALTDAERRALGLAPSAAATYRKKQGISFAGYGEMLYENFDGRDESGVAAAKTSQLDFLRVILYAGYRFSDRFIFNSEIELEHANEVSVEFAYLDYLVHRNLTLRGGMLLVPLGLVNEFHEPTVLIGARRSETETRILPSTWRENGFGALGSSGPVSYRLYLINGLNAAGFAADGLRGGRQKGSRSKTADWALAGRLDVTPAPGVVAGLGFYNGGSDQGQFSLGGRELSVGTTIVELHGQAQARGFDFRGLYARATLDDVASLNAARGLTGSRSIGETLRGGYLQAGYNVLSQLTGTLSVTPYYRYERVDTQQEVPPGFAVDPSRDGTFHTLGVEVRPIQNVVVKADYQVIRNEAKTGRNQLNINLGYAF